MQGCVLSSNDNINHIWLGRWNIHARPSPHFLNNEELCSTLLFPTTHRCVCSIAHKAILINPSRSFIRFSYTDSQNLILRIITLCPFFWFLVVLFELLCFHWSCITSCFCLHSLVSSPLHIYRNSVLQSIQPEIKRAEEIWPLMQSLLNAYVVAVTLSPPRLTHTAQKHRWLRSNLRDNMINRFTLSKATCPGHRWRADVSGPWCCLHSLSLSDTQTHAHTVCKYSTDLQAEVTGWWWFSVSPHCCPNHSQLHDTQQPGLLFIFYQTDLLGDRHGLTPLPPYLPCFHLIHMPPLYSLPPFYLTPISFPPFSWISSFSLLSTRIFYSCFTPLSATQVVKCTNIATCRTFCELLRWLLVPSLFVFKCFFL